MNEKYELTDESIMLGNIKIHRIRAIKDFDDVKNGDLGGFIQNESNLSQDGKAWIKNNAIVYGDAKVYGNAQVYDDAQVHGNAKVYYDAQVYGNAQVHGNAKVYYDAQIFRT